MSYIAFELDALNKVPHVAMAAGLRAADISHGLLMLWSHCFREEVDHVSDRQLVGFFGTKGVGEALASFDFLEADIDRDGWWRVRGAGRYLRLRESRREGGRKGRAKQLETTRALKSPVEPGVSPGKTAKKRGQAEPGQNAGPESPNEPGPKSALKSPVEPGQKRALSPNTEGVLLTENTKQEASAPDPVSVGAPPTPSAGAVGEGAESSDQPDPVSWRPLPTPPPPTLAQARCMAMRWGGTRTPEHAEALMAWSRESGVPETRLRKWLAEQEEPLYFAPSVLISQRREIENARKFPPTVTQ